MKTAAILSVIALTLTAGVSAKVNPSWDNYPRSPDDPMIWLGPRRECIGPYAPKDGLCGSNEYGMGMTPPPSPGDIREVKTDDLE
ncbi:predicted protein [Uncinocarpus reesii 1704]|uniref:Uncharacterized protein n=1 Tax=Uncinocarpus reesii (strain UAMH 1704) TaxID=336963 RepID=C4JXT9_UNCRE|nr:uncharacterized protein UREG_07877 [Uncinocarpus reesii 1704]EEP83012.1 predicted protein [Uncinocarpus reesii 1704]